MEEIYYYSPSMKCCYLKSLHGENIPPDAITLEDKTQLDLIVSKICEQATIIYENGEFSFIPFTISSEQQQEILKCNALYLLQSSDYKMLSDVYASYTVEQQDLIIAYRAELRKVLNNERFDLPILEL